MGLSFYAIRVALNTVSSKNYSNSVGQVGPFVRYLASITCAEMSLPCALVDLPAEPSSRNLVAWHGSATRVVLLERPDIPPPSPHCWMRPRVLTDLVKAARFASLPARVASGLLPISWPAILMRLAESSIGSIGRASCSRCARYCGRQAHSWALTSCLGSTKASNPSVASRAVASGEIAQLDKRPSPN
jgi:hypothetical protein